MRLWGRLEQVLLGADALEQVLLGAGWSRCCLGRRQDHEKIATRGPHMKRLDASTCIAWGCDTRPAH